MQPRPGALVLKGDPDLLEEPVRRVLDGVQIVVGQEPEPVDTLHDVRSLQVQGLIGMLRREWGERRPCSTDGVSRRPSGRGQA
jgi:hypothetical protein